MWLSSFKICWVFHWFPLWFAAWDPLTAVSLTLTGWARHCLWEEVYSTTKWTKAKATWQTKSDHNSHENPMKQRKNHEHQIEIPWTSHIKIPWTHHTTTIKTTISGCRCCSSASAIHQKRPSNEEDLVTVRNFLSESERAAAMEAAKDLSPAGFMVALWWNYGGFSNDYIMEYRTYHEYNDTFIVIQW